MQEKRLKIKSDIILIEAKEQVYAEAGTLERGSTFELGLKSKELSTQNCVIKEREGTGAASMGGLLHLCPALNQECINHKPVLKLLKKW